MRQITVDELNNFIKETELYHEREENSEDGGCMDCRIVQKYFQELYLSDSPFSMEIRQIPEDMVITINSCVRESAPISYGPCADPFPESPETIVLWTNEEPKLVSQETKSKNHETGWITHLDFKKYKIGGPVVISNDSVNYLDFIIYK